jgi:hypothetical protein
MATALYPTSVQTFASQNPRTDNIDAVMAADVNLLYVEVTAIEGILGTTPATSTWSGSFDGTTTAWATVNSRLTNIEAGVLTTYNDRVKASGGSTISTSGTTVGLTLNTSGSGNLLNANNNTVINSNGYIVTIDGGTA